MRQVAPTERVGGEVRGQNIGHAFVLLRRGASSDPRAYPTLLALSPLWRRGNEGRREDGGGGGGGLRYHTEALAALRGVGGEMRHPAQEAPHAPGRSH